MAVNPGATVNVDEQFEALHPPSHPPPYPPPPSRRDDESKEKAPSPPPSPPPGPNRQHRSRNGRQTPPPVGELQGLDQDDRESRAAELDIEGGSDMRKGELVGGYEITERTWPPVHGRALLHARRTGLGQQPADHRVQDG